MLNGPQRAVMQLTPEEERLVKRMQEYRTDLGLHAVQCLRVIDKERRLTPLTLNAPQLLVHARLEHQRREFGMVRALVLKGRKQGVSTYIGARFYSRARLWPHRRAKVMAHEQSSTDVLFDMVKTYYDHDPLRLRAEAKSAKELTFSNGSSYSVATAGGSGESGRGDTPDLAHLSEVAFYKNPEKNFAGFVNSVPTAKGTEIIAESTANGVGNEFHRRWLRAEANTPEEGAGSDQMAFQAIFVPWWLSDEYRRPVPFGFQLSGEPEGEGLPSEVEIAELHGLSLEQMAWRRYKKEEDLGGSVVLFMQEFPCTPQEAFQSTAGEQFIGSLWVLRARKRRNIPALGPRILGIDPAGQGGDRFVAAFRQGHVLHWTRPKVGLEPDEAVHWVASLIEEVQPDTVNIDYSGGYGSGLVAGMRLQYPKLAEKLVPIDFGAKSQAKTVAPHRPGPRNRRAEMYLRLRDWFMMTEGVSIPDEDQLQEDLAAITQRIQNQVTDVLIESKVEIKKRLGRSPDIADAVALTFAIPDTVIDTALPDHRPGGTEIFATGGAPARPTPPERRVDTWATGSRWGGDSSGGWMR